MLAVVVPPVVALTRFGFFVSEPRYALPLYSTRAAAGWRTAGACAGRPLAALVGDRPHCRRSPSMLWSVLSTDPRLWRPEDTPRQHRRARARALVQLPGRRRTATRSIPTTGSAIRSCSRRARPCWPTSSRAASTAMCRPPTTSSARPTRPGCSRRARMPSGEFLDQLPAVGGQAHVTDVSVYRVYTDVSRSKRCGPRASSSVGRR